MALAEELRVVREGCGWTCARDQVKLLTDAIEGSLPAGHIALLKAHDHQYGRGKVHLISVDADGNGQTRCGMSPQRSPGLAFLGNEHEITCQRCTTSIEAEREHQQQYERYERERQQRREEYNAYLASPAWRQRRAKVMKRAGHRCEGCDRQRATQVHHLTYDRIFHEMLFDLVAVCDECHKSIHADKIAGQR